MGDMGGRRSSGLSAAGAVRLLAAAVFMGYIVLWTISPTNRYREKWLPKLRADTNSTYFGTQGCQSSLAGVLTVVPTSSIF